MWTTEKILLDRIWSKGPPTHMNLAFKGYYRKCMKPMTIVVGITFLWLIPKRLLVIKDIHSSNNEKLSVFFS